LFQNRAFFETKSKHFVEPNGPQMTMWSLRIACWIPRATIHTQNM